MKSVPWKETLEQLSCAFELTSYWNAFGGGGGCIWLLAAASAFLQTALSSWSPSPSVLEVSMVAALAHATASLLSFYLENAEQKWNSIKIEQELCKGFSAAH